MAINKTALSIIILAGNEEKMIIDCLKTSSWAKEIVLVAANSTDNTVKLAQKTIPTIKIVKTFDDLNSTLDLILFIKLFLTSEITLKLFVL